MSEKSKKAEMEIYDKKNLSSEKPKWGEQWDSDLMDFVMLPHNQLIDSWANKYLKGKDVLIIGGGKDESHIVKNLCKSITIVNISKAEINEATSFYPKSTLFLVGDVEKFSFDKNTFDVILCKSILHHLNIDIVLNNVKKILRPKGKIFISLEPSLLNPIAYIGRTFFPTNIHTPFERPFVIYKFRRKLKRFGFIEENFECFCLFSHLFPIFAKYSLVNNLRWLVDFILTIEKYFLKTFFREFCWYFSAIYTKPNSLIRKVG